VQVRIMVPRLPGERRGRGPRTKRADGRRYRGQNKRALTMGLTAYVDSTMTLLNLVVGGEQTVSGLVQNTGVDLDSPPSQQQFTSWNILAKTV
jgi:hypothetical protein